MKIALIVSMKYGLTQFMFRDIEALVNKGHDIRLFSLLNTPGLYNPLPHWSVTVLRWWQLPISQLALVLRKPLLYLQLLGFALQTHSLSDFFIAVQFAQAMEDVDLIYSYFGDHKFFVGYYCKRILGTPLAVTIRAYELHNNPNPTLFRHALAECDQVVTVSDYNKTILVEQFGALPDQIEVVRQILDLEAFKASQKIKILIVGFFSEKKGHEILFQAVKLLNREDIEVWVVGDEAPDRRLVDCRRMAKELQMEDKIAFFGEQSGAALRALFRECDIFCLPSRTDSAGDKEGFPNVIMEAMAFSKPVVSTYHAGIPEVVDRILVDENNVEQLAAALEQVCASAELRRQLGAHNRKRVERLFSMANNDRLEAMLYHCVKQCNAGEFLQTAPGR